MCLIKIIIWLTSLIIYFYFMVKDLFLWLLSPNVSFLIKFSHQPLQLSLHIRKTVWVWEGKNFTHFLWGIWNYGHVFETPVTANLSFIESGLLKCTDHCSLHFMGLWYHRNVYHLLICNFEDMKRNNYTHLNG